MKDTATNAAKLNGLYKNYSTNNKGYVTSTSPYATYTDGDAKEYLTGAGIAKTSKEYTVTLDTVSGGKNAVITVDDNAKIYFVDKDGNISESSYKAIYQDVNDKVYAIVEDYLVKTLVVEEVDDGKVPSAPADLDYTASTKISGVTVTVNVKNTVSNDDVLDMAIAALDEAGYTDITATAINTISATKGKVTRVFDVVRNDAYKVTFTSTQTLSVKSVWMAEGDTVSVEVGGAWAGYTVTADNSFAVTKVTFNSDKTIAYATLTAPAMSADVTVTIGYTTV